MALDNRNMTVILREPSYRQPWWWWDSHRLRQVSNKS